MNKRERLLIIGASSFLGGALVPLLLKRREYQLILTCRNKDGCAAWKNAEDVNVEYADLRDNDRWDAIFDKYKPGKVILLAAVARFSDGEKNPLATVEINFWGVLNIIELCKKYKTDTFLFTSSDLARNAISTVGITKYLVERLIIANSDDNLKMIGIRVANLIDGKGSVTTIFRRQIEDNQCLTVTHPDMSRRFNTREEAAEDLLWLLENGKANSMYVVNKAPLKIVDLAKDMIKKSGKDIEIRFIGAKPGEKLSEPSYDKEYIVKPVKGRQIALFDKSNYQNENIDDFIGRLKVEDDVKMAVAKVFRK